MGTIPAPNIPEDIALGQQGYQNALSEYSRVAQLRAQTNEEQQAAAVQQQQSHAMQVENQETDTARQLAPQFVQKDENGKPTGFDTEGYYNSLLGSGMNPATVQAYKQKQLDYQKGLTQLGSDQLDLQHKKNEDAYQIIEPLRQSATDPKGDLGQINTTWKTVAPQLIKLGLNPSELPASFQSPQDAQQRLQGFETELAQHKQLLADAKTTSETNKNNAEANHNKYENVNGVLYDVSGDKPVPALGAGTTPQDYFKLVNNTIDAKKYPDLNQRTHQAVDFYMQQGNTKAANDAITKAQEQIGAIEKEINPDVQAAQIARAKAEGAARAQAYGSTREYQVFDNKTHQTVYMDANTLNDAKITEPGRYTAPAYTPEAIGQKTATQYFIGGKGGQQLNAFNAAMQHLDLLDNLSTDLQNTNLQIYNRAAQRWAQETGEDAPVNFNAAKNAMSGEVAAALKASGATDQEIEKVDQTFDRAQSPDQLHGAIQTYRSLLKSKAHSLGMQYQQGMQGKPNFGDQNSPSGGDFFSQFGGKKR